MTKNKTTKNKMIKLLKNTTIVSLFMMIFCSCFLFFISCTPVIKIPDGLNPTVEFTINDYLEENAIFQENANLKLSGEAETNVNIVIEIKNAKNIIINTYYTITNKLGKWEINLKTPKASTDNYQIVVRDSYSKFVKIYNNIRFGYVWLLAGEMIENTTDEEIIEKEPNNNLRYFIQDEVKGIWVTNDKVTINNKINDYAYKFGNELVKKTNMPINIIIINQKNTNIDEWLFQTDIEEKVLIKSYLENQNRYQTSPKLSGDAAYLGEMVIKKLEGLSLEGIVFNQGLKELNKFNNQDFMTFYYRVMVNLAEKWYNYFGKNLTFAIVQAGSSFDNNIVNFRTIQTLVSNYFSFVKIIPIFDLDVEVLNEKLEVIKIINGDINKIIEREIKIITGKDDVSHYDRVLFEIDEETEIVNNIVIEFGNTKALHKKNDDEINYLTVFYQDPEAGLIELDIEPTINKNMLVFSLQYDKEITDEEGNITTIPAIYDYHLITIIYGEQGNLCNNNLYNDDLLPILSFNIKMD